MDASTQIGIVGILVAVLLWLIDRRGKAVPRGRFAHLRDLPRQELKLFGLAFKRSARYGELDRKWWDGNPYNKAAGSAEKAEAFEALGQRSLMVAMGLTSARKFAEVAENLKRLGLIQYGPVDLDIYPDICMVFITDLGLAAARGVPKLNRASV
ncbi:MAG: hypothetical protein HYX77_07890 [Acidobacteria bacterium]|nr:hypothetical protein [Acidobacteriota bacterium]